MVWKPDVRIKTAFASGSASSSASAPEAALANFVTPAVAAPPVGAQPVDTDASLQANRSTSMQVNQSPQTPPCTVIWHDDEICSMQIEAKKPVRSEDGREANMVEKPNCNVD